MQDNKMHSRNNQVEGLLDDQYYKAEEDVAVEIADLISATADSQLRNVLSREFINVTDEIEAIKKDMFLFMEEQAKKV